MAITILKQNYIIQVFMFSNSPFIHVYLQTERRYCINSKYLEVTGRGVLQASSYMLGKTIKRLEKYELG